MITREEYEKTYIRMMDSMREDYKGSGNCKGVACDGCPLSSTFCAHGEAKAFNIYKAIEVVEKWGKEHPIVTRADKFKEVFGVEPRTKYNDYICPVNVGLSKECSHRDEQTEWKDCMKCAKDFWESEYVEPSKGE